MKLALGRLGLVLGSVLATAFVLLLLGAGMALTAWLVGIFD